MTTRQKRSNEKLLHRQMIQEVAVEFKNQLHPPPANFKGAVQSRRYSVAHYELARATIAEILDLIDETLSENRPVVLRGFGRWVPRRYKPTSGRRPGRRSDDESAIYSIPVRVGVLFRPSAQLKEAIQEHDKQHGLPTHSRAEL